MFVLSCWWLLLLFVCDELFVLVVVFVQLCPGDGLRLFVFAAVCGLLLALALTLRLALALFLACDFQRCVIGRRV